MSSRSRTSGKSKADDCLMLINSQAEEVRILALNLAINLARSKDELKDLAFMEPEFTRLINGSVEVIKQIGDILKTFRNEDKMAYNPPETNPGMDRIEASLNDILKISREVLHNIGEMKKRKKNLSKYKKL
nr:hypothetical protein [candidate division Zixibacteria bacterium]